MMKSGMETSPLQQPVPGFANSTAVYFPCNREDALVFLSALCISESVPGPSIALPLEPTGIALLRDGVRDSEITLLEAGEQQRFVLLLEVAADVASLSRLITLSDIKSLVFAKQGHADDFRYRPVDEVDTASLPFRIEPALFGLPGPARFQVRTREPSYDDAAVAVDRLAAGVAFVLALAEAQPLCRSAAVDFLSKTVAETSAEDLSFACVCEVLLAPHVDQKRTERAVLLEAFSRATTSGGPRLLIENVEAQLASGQHDVGDSRTFARWAEMARDVLQSRVELTADHLTDERSMLLRGALLAITCDGPGTVAVFLDSEKPVGRKVAVIAAFMAGLRQGVQILSWSEKKRSLGWLPGLLRDLLSSFPDGGDAVAKELGVVWKGEGATRQAAVESRGRVLAQWSLPTVAEEQSALSREVGDSGYEQLGRGQMEGSLLTRLPSGHIIEVSEHRTKATQCRVLRFYCEKDRKQRSKKDVAAAFGGGGMVWYPGVLETGAVYLFCDVQRLPLIADSKFLCDKLIEAADALMQPLKKTRPRRTASGSAKQKSPGRVVAQASLLLPQEEPGDKSS
jgi:hypothetical protein